MDKFCATCWLITGIAWGMGDSPVVAVICAVPLAYHYARIFRSEKSE